MPELPLADEAEEFEVVEDDGASVLVGVWTE